MPRRDGTGPRGQGPMTEHAGGDCVLREFQNNPGCFEGILGRLGRPVTLKIDSRNVSSNVSFPKDKKDEGVSTVSLRNKE